MLETALAVYRLRRGEPIEKDIPMIALFGKQIHDEIKGFAFDQLFRRSWGVEGF